MRRSLARNREVPSLPIELADRSHDPERLLELKQRRQVLDMALDQLPHDQRVVFVLFELEGFSLPEVASSLGIPLGTATSRLRRGRQRFEAWVAERESSGGRP
jgi:RNA polymerase sigma-70 factor (ECF subfamily)